MRVASLADKRKVTQARRSGRAVNVAPFMRRRTLLGSNALT